MRAFTLLRGFLLLLVVLSVLIFSASVYISNIYSTNDRRSPFDYDANKFEAFPGAEGEGAMARGGRGGDVYHVTSLLDDANLKGTLRHAITSMVKGSPRTVVFDVSGTITLNSSLVIKKPYLTLAGYTAPGDGITIRGWQVIIEKTSHVIVRYLRFRTGDVNCPTYQADSLLVLNSTDVIVDHVSASWSVDETLSVTASHRVTVQWSIISESLANSCHQKGPHGFASLVRYGNGNITMHHNLFACHMSRIPRVGDNITLDFVANVVAFWSKPEAGYSMPDEYSEHRVNVVDNYYDAGHRTGNKAVFGAHFYGPSKINTHTLLYFHGNMIDRAPHPRSRTPRPMNISREVYGTYIRSDKRFPLTTHPISVGGAKGTYKNVLYDAGASLVRDSVDIRVIDSVKKRTGKTINSQNQVDGWPTLNSLPAPLDSDGDGIPDVDEVEMHLDPSDPHDAAHRGNNTHYSFLELYHHNLIRRKVFKREPLIYSKEVIQIVFGTNTPFLTGTMTTMLSVKSLTKSPVVFHVFVQDKEAIQATQNALECLGLIEYVDTLRVFVPPVQGINRLKPELSLNVNFVRLFLGSELPGVSKVLWLDSDVIVQQDISELWDLMQKDNRHTLAVKEREKVFNEREGWTNSSRFLSLWKERYHRPPPDFAAFNAGVLMINLDHMRAHDLYLQHEMEWWMHVNLHKEIWRMGSQPLCALLAAISPSASIGVIPQKWHSHDWGWRPPPFEELRKVSLVHYSGEKKPWLAQPSTDPIWQRWEKSVRACIPV